jgi:hypothetical protein
MALFLDGSHRRDHRADEAKLGTVKPPPFGPRPVCNIMGQQDSTHHMPLRTFLS